MPRTTGSTPPIGRSINGDDKAVRELAAALGVRYRRDAAAASTTRRSSSILDADGRIVTQQPDAQANTEEMVKKLTTLFAPATH